uniref:Solute carrier family 12 member 6 n=1 Tax=Trichuris muris TaxID=70415 RepID=A0A5S6QV31_TRIMR
METLEGPTGQVLLNEEETNNEDSARRRSLSFSEEDGAPAGIKVSQFIRRLSLYSTMPLGGPELDEKKETTKPVMMGTFVGVFMPCIQNIFGVLFFIRLAWMVGTAGLLEAFVITLICCLVTFTTSISLSAIATNGMVPAGGPYYMISRNLGPELGGAVGILFYLATTIAAAMYILGSAEIFLLYAVPQAKIFDDIYHCYRLFASLLLAVISCIVVAGVSVVNKFALPTIALVNSCILLTFIGFFVNINGSDSLKFCMVGDRIPDLQNWIDHHPGHYLACNATDLRHIFCANVSVDSTCDPYFLEASRSNTIRQRRAIEGAASGIIKANIFPKYLDIGEIVSANLTTEKEEDDAASKMTEGFVVADMATSFTILIGVFFPSVTGIMQGSNRSGNLKDASLSIPVGTLAAQLITSCAYLLGVLCFGAAINDVFLRDKFGAGAYGRLAVAELAVPHPMVIVVGSFIASAGAGMQCLTGAPRLLQAIASDGVIPLIRPFQKTTRGEPLRAILLSICICECCILIAFLESITALISQFFLMCYMSVNAACALQSILKAPSWRPRFRFYHWTLSMFGAASCVAVMFMSHWLFAIVAFGIGALAYKYIEYRGAEKEWGDGIRGLRLSAASYALRTLEEGPVHTRNWRPQILVFCTVSGRTMKKGAEKLVAFASQMKAGKGLTVLATVIQGRFVNMEPVVSATKETLKEVRARMKIKGFYEVLVAREVIEGISALVQTSGLGGMEHNTVIIGWPSKWKNSLGKAEKFVEIIRFTGTAKKALVVLKNSERFPDNSERITGNIDVWWILHDGGIMILLGFLLLQNRVWKNTKLRIFTVAHHDDDVAKIRESLKKFIYYLRIDAFVDVVELSEYDISEYAHELSLKRDQRSKMLCQLGLAGKEKEIQGVIENAAYVSKKGRSEETVREDEESNRTDNVNADVSKSSLNNRRTDCIRRTQRYTIRCIQRAAKLNEAIQSRSGDAQLVCLNLPEPRGNDSDTFYMEYIETLTMDLDRVVLVKGTGSEVVTIFS